ncbi:MAG: tetratricopeptide repeat protein [Candidatus Sulfotelmatobacter sp.]
MAVHRDPLAHHRLDSWKEIAAFFGRAERTVKRWESERGLPVHRVPGNGRSSVFAYTHELADWLKSRPEDLDSEAPTPSELAPPSGDSAGAIAAEPALDKPANEEVAAVGSQGPSFGSTPRAHTRALWAAASASFLLIVLLIIFLAQRGTFRFASAGSHHSSNSEAQELYLKGRYFWSRRTPEDLTRAIDYFTQAIVRDPGNAEAYVGLADCYNLLREFGVMPAADAYPRAIAAAQRAVELDDTSAQAHNSLAFATFWWLWKGATAEREFKRALQLNPDLVRAHHWYATYLMALHRFPEAIDQIDQAQRLEPGSSALLADKGYLLWCAGRHSEALALLKQLETTDPSLSSTHYYLARIAWEQRDYTDAIAEWRTVAELRHDQAGLALADARAGGLSSGGLRGMLQAQISLQKTAVDAGGGDAYDLAVSYAALGRTRDALAYLQLAFDRREAGLLTSDPPIPALQNDPEYRRLMARVHKELAQ